MDKQAIKKLTTLSFLCAGVLSYVTVNTVFKSLAGAFGIVQRWYSIELLNHGLPVIAGIAVFAVLQFSPRILTWAEEVISETSKVVWPSKNDTVAMTVVVCVFVGIASAILVVIDYLSREFVRMIIH